MNILSWLAGIVLDIFTAAATIVAAALIAGTYTWLFVTQASGSQRNKR